MSDIFLAEKDTAMWTYFFFFLPKTSHLLTSIFATPTGLRYFDSQNIYDTRVSSSIVTGYGVQSKL
jgi:hypothetical protein